MIGAIPGFGRFGRNGAGAQIGQGSLVTRAASIAATGKNERLVMTVLAWGEEVGTVAYRAGRRKRGREKASCGEAGKLTLRLRGNPVPPVVSRLYANVLREM
ncbi:hypothetical protein PQR53_04650 [Paraburkholderia fungorum]|uniref:hypothetical protein n=1 Tax=Paraburkholderia fungorum TaxID=134537 RepID=UPI0038BCD7DD